jgi:tetratricopeptide (TPR) repeat protein
MSLSRDQLTEEYLAQLPYPPYSMQEDALLAWFTAAQGVLVCAPTGTGKTVIAQAALYEALHTGTVAYYTTPLIALTDAGPRGYHYVVLLAWANRRVMFHDPALGPFRVMPEAEWLRRWNLSDRWALLILPNTPKEATARRPLQAAAEEDACAPRVRPAIESADRGELQSAKRDLAAAAEACPDSSAPLRELAGLEFRLENWAGASALAERAVARNRDDALSWRLLATSRFLAGRPEAALDAWNEVGEPKLDLVSIDGLERTPFRTVYDSLGTGPDDVLTSPSLLRARRRVAALPAAEGSRVSYRPLPGGRARLEVAIVERPTIDLLPLLLESAIRAFTDHAAARASPTSRRRATRAGPSGAGSRTGRRSRSPHPLPARWAPGIVTAEVLWDEQSYRVLRKRQKAP